MTLNTVIRTDILSLNAHRHMNNVGNMQTRAAQRLSSGFRINSAADDAAGLAISSKMRAQIRGLDQAWRNAQDGISLIQTAEGAMSTINSMLIRVRELIIQAANDTNVHDMSNAAQSDRRKIQDEINQIMDEINSVAHRTEFNTRRLLDGSLENGKTSFNHAFMGISLSSMSQVNRIPRLFPNQGGTAISLPPGTTLTTLTPQPHHAFLSVSPHASRTQNFDLHGVFNVPGYGEVLNIGNGVRAAPNAGERITVAYVNMEAGNSYLINMSSGDFLGNVILIAPDGTEFDVDTLSPGILSNPHVHDIVFDSYRLHPNTRTPNFYFNHVNISGTWRIEVEGTVDNQEVLFQIYRYFLREPENGPYHPYPPYPPYYPPPTPEKRGVLWLQLGAIQNRLEFTAKSLSISSENLSASKSRIKDADMAREMMRLTQANVLQQAAMSMLAQANQSSNAVLHLLHT